jgi:hypothetical protein
MVEPVVANHVEPVVVASGNRVDPSFLPSSHSSVHSRRAVQPPASGNTVRTLTSASPPSTWLHRNGQRVVIESTGMLHADHPTTVPVRCDIDLAVTSPPSIVCRSRVDLRPCDPGLVATACSAP